MYDEVISHGKMKRCSALVWALSLWVHDKWEGKRRLTGVQLASHPCSRAGDRKAFLRLRVKSLPTDPHPGMVSTILVVMDTHRGFRRRSFEFTIAKVE